MSKKHEREVRVFNAANPVGSPVRYWSGERIGAGAEGFTRSPAQLLSGHTAVVWVTGQAGCVALSHVQAEERKT